MLHEIERSALAASAGAATIKTQITTASRISSLSECIQIYFWYKLGMDWVLKTRASDFGSGMDGEIGLRQIPGTLIH